MSLLPEPHHDGSPLDGPLDTGPELVLSIEPDGLADAASLTLWPV